MAEVLFCHDGERTIWRLHGMIFWYSTRPQRTSAGKFPTDTERRHQFDVREVPGYMKADDPAVREFGGPATDWGAVARYHAAVIRRALRRGIPLTPAEGAEG